MTSASLLPTLFRSFLPTKDVLSGEISAQFKHKKLHAHNLHAHDVDDEIHAQNVGLYMLCAHDHQSRPITQISNIAQMGNLMPN